MCHAATPPLYLPQLHPAFTVSTATKHHRRRPLNGSSACLQSLWSWCLLGSGLKSVASCSYLCVPTISIIVLPHIMGKLETSKLETSVCLKRPKRSFVQDSKKENLAALFLYGLFFSCSSLGYLSVCECWAVLLSSWLCSLSPPFLSEFL